MRFRLRCTLLPAMLALVFVPPLPSAVARTKPQPAAFDRNYASALAAADRFLHAWQTQDEEAGLLLLTDRARQHTNEDRLRDFFSSGRTLNPGFEIGRGTKLSAMRYKFPVALFSGDPTHLRQTRRPQACTLIVVRLGRDDWAIDKLP